MINFSYRPNCQLQVTEFEILIKKSNLTAMPLTLFLVAEGLQSCWRPLITLTSDIELKLNLLVFHQSKNAFCLGVHHQNFNLIHLQFRSHLLVEQGHLMGSIAMVGWKCGLFLGDFGL